MMKFLTPILIVLFTIVTSCEKEPLTYKIEGQLVDFYSEKPVSGVTVNLFQKEYKSGVLNDNYTFVETVLTDSEGNYKFVLDRIKIFEIKLDVDHPNYYKKTKIYSSSFLNSQEVNFFNEKIESKSWITITLKNPFVGPGEQINLYKTKFKTDCETCCSNGLTAFFETGDTTFTCAAVGGSQVTLDYGVLGNSAQFNTTIDCIPFDTTFVSISY